MIANDVAKEPQDSHYHINVSVAADATCFHGLCVRLRVRRRSSVSLSMMLAYPVKLSWEPIRRSGPNHHVRQIVTMRSAKLSSVRLPIGHPTVACLLTR
jgi:hypothetical protein